LSVGGVIDQLQDPTSAMGALNNLLPNDSPIKDFIKGYETIEKGLNAAAQFGLYLPDQAAAYLADAGLGLWGTPGTWAGKGAAQGWSAADGVGSLAQGSASILSSLVGGMFTFVGTKILGDIIASQGHKGRSYADDREDALMRSDTPLLGALAPLVQGGLAFLNPDATDKEKSAGLDKFGSSSATMMDMMNNFVPGTSKDDPQYQLAAGWLVAGFQQLANGVETEHTWGNFTFSSTSYPPGFNDRHDIENALEALTGDPTLAYVTAYYLGGEHQLKGISSEDFFTQQLEKIRASIDMPITEDVWTPMFEGYAENKGWQKTYKDSLKQDDDEDKWEDDGSNYWS